MNIKCEDRRVMQKMDYKSILVFVSVLAFCNCARSGFNPGCNQGYYFNREARECTLCSTCEDNQVIQRNCFDDVDTLCGAFPDFQFLRPQPSKESTDDFQQNVAKTAEIPTTSTEMIMETDDKWFTITMVLVGILVLTCASGVIIVLVTCVVCRRKDREIIYEPEYMTACTLIRDDSPVTKGTVMEQFKLVSERES